MNILWDLDGTLADSMPLIAASMNETLVAFGAGEHTPAQLRPYIGPGIHRSFARLLGTDDGERIEAAVHHYRQCTAASDIVVEPFAGIEAVLEDLKIAGCQQFVATAKYIGSARTLLEAKGLAGYFLGVYGADAQGQGAHKPDLLDNLLGQEGLSSAETLMIGDTRYDMEAARAHDLTAIGVRWGYGTDEELRAGGAHRLVDTPTALLTAIRESLACVC